MDTLTRRSFLRLGAGIGVGAVAAGCSPPPPPPPVTTVAELLAHTPFYIAHRGSGDNWPEHTALAYRQAAAAGARALEVSVQATRDGVLVCHHDLSLLRMTGVDALLSSLSHAELVGLLNNARPWLGPRSMLLPIPTLKEVLDEHAAQRVIFIEDKQGSNSEALLDLLDSYPQATEHFVWKQPGGSQRYRLARERGYATWGYFTAEEAGSLAAAAGFDYLGVDAGSSPDMMREIVALGKPVIAWEVHTRSLRDTLVARGVRGIMCSNIPYVTGTAAARTADDFASGLRSAGDLPDTLAWERQPLISAETSSVLLSGGPKSSYCLGSLAPVTRAEYTLSCDLAWPQQRPDAYEHAGIAFGQSSDAPYVVREESTVGGYHLVLRGDGSLELFVRGPGTVSGQSLGKVATTPPVPGAWMPLAVQVGPDRLRVSRGDGRGWAFTATDGRYRGGYLSLCRNYDAGPDVQFRAVNVG